MGTMKIMGMDYTALLARVIAVLASRPGADLSIKMADIKKLEPNARLSFSLNEDENILTIKTVASSVEEAPLFGLFEAADVSRETSGTRNRVVRRSPEEIAHLILEKQREAEVRIAQDTAPVTGRQ